MADDGMVHGHRESPKKWLRVAVAVGSVILGASVGIATVAEANAAPLAGRSVRG